MHGRSGRARKTSDNAEWGTFTGPITITITTPSNTGISYTLDGTDPWGNSKAVFINGNIEQLIASGGATIKAETRGIGTGPIRYCKKPEVTTAVFIIN